MQVRGNGRRAGRGVRAAVLVSAGLVALTASRAAAQLAATPWPMFQHDSRHTGQSSHLGPHTSKLLWTHKTDSVPRISPTIAADGTLYVPVGHHPLCALDPADGSQLWCSGQLGDAFSSAAAVDVDGTVYIGDRSNNLEALHPNDGSAKWRYKVKKDGDVRTSPVILDDGNVLMASGFGTFMHILFPDGTVDLTNNLTRGSANLSPAVAADGTIYMGRADGALFALNPDLSVRWSVLKNKFGRNGSTNHFSSPAIAADGTVYIGGTMGLTARNPDGSLKWQFPLRRCSATPAIASDGTIYVGADSRSNGGLYAIHPDGTQKWFFSTGEPVRSAAVMASDGVIYFNSLHQVWAVKPDQTKLWSFSINRSGFSTSSPTLGDQTLYVAAPDGLVYAFNDSGT